MLNIKKLGNQGLEVCEIGLGCMGMSHAYGKTDEKNSVATIHRAIEIGCNFFDTAEIYGPFANESLLGRALRGRRKTVRLTPSELSILDTAFSTAEIAGARYNPDFMGLVDR